MLQGNGASGRPRLKDLRRAFQNTDTFEERERKILHFAIKAGSMSKHSELIAHHERVNSGALFVCIRRKTIGGSKEINEVGILRAWKSWKAHVVTDTKQWEGRSVSEALYLPKKGQLSTYVVLTARKETQQQQQAFWKD